MNKLKIMVAMSGGVDSSVAAALLKEQGHDICGATLKLFSSEDIGLEKTTRTCCSLDDVSDARSVAYRLGFEHYVFNFGSQFKEEVIDRFANSYLNGETPNPCIDCNRYIKFSKMIDRAHLMDMEYIATGHYARREYDEQSGRYLLKKAKDHTKDQSYVLYSLTQQQLRHTLFPLGGFTKQEIRAMAEERGLVNAKKPDSQDICFVPDGDYAAFLKNVLHIETQPGKFLNMQGKTLGDHKGLIHYTIGQRKGLNLSLDRPHYVIEKDPTSNSVWLGDETDLFRDTMLLTDVNLISIAELKEPMRAMVKTRYHHQEAPATLSPQANGTISVKFDAPQRALTPGQAAVFYDGEIVIGGGTIMKDR